MTPQQIEYVLLVAQLRSFSKAAAAYCLTLKRLVEIGTWRIL